MYLERFDVENSTSSEMALLDYIEDIGEKICPDYDFNSKGEVVFYGTSADMRFVNRYNSGIIRLKQDWRKYFENADIKHCLEKISLNDGSEISFAKFWYLILFLYDYSRLQCFAPCQHLSRLPKEELEDFVKFADMVADHEVTISLDIDGKSALRLENKSSINYLMSCCRELPEWLINYDYLSSLSKKQNTNAEWGYYFCELLHEFFDLVGVKRHPLAKWSDNEKRLLCHILYLTGICTNKNILNYEITEFSTLKTFIKPKKIPTIRTTNRLY